MIRFDAGYEDPADLPGNVKVAVLLMLRHLYTMGEVNLTLSSGVRRRPAAIQRAGQPADTDPGRCAQSVARRGLVMASVAMARLAVLGPRTARHVWPPKDPAERRIAYAVDWTARLAAGDTLATSTFDLPSGLVAENATNTAR